MADLIKPIIAVVDDDPRVRQSLGNLIEAAGFTARVFPLAEEYLREGLLAGTNCLITDVRMPGLNGLELQRRVRLERPELPVIFISGHHDDDVESSALADGAISFFRKPFDAGELLRAIQLALSKPSGGDEKAR